MELTVLGNKRENPFSLKNINKANEILYKGERPSLSKSHNYTKFIPSSYADVEAIEEWESNSEIVLVDYPMEYEVLQMGDYYIDPTSEDPNLTPYYGSVPIDKQMPEVATEILDDLFLDKSNPILIATSFWLTGNESEINSYVFNGGLTIDDVEGFPSIPLEIIPPYPTNYCPFGQQWVLIYLGEETGPNGNPLLIFDWICQEIPNAPDPVCNCPSNGNPNIPAGCIVVEAMTRLDPVQNLTVRVKDNWFFGESTRTDVNGCWEMKDQHSGQIWVKTKFDNQNVEVRDLRYFAFIRLIRHNVGSFSGAFNNIEIVYESGDDDNTSKKRSLWNACTAINTVERYHQMAASDGIPLPRKLNWHSKAGQNNASAAMLQGTNFNLTSALMELHGFNISSAFPLSLLPDITLNYRVGDDSNILTEIGSHELGHATHYMLVGEEYWIPYRIYIVVNLGWGTNGSFKPGSYPGHAQLGEAFGEYMESRYGFEFSPDAKGILNGFVPGGMLWDLEDTQMDFTIDPQSGTVFIDNISGFTPAMFYNSLTPFTTNVRAFRDRLRNGFLASTPNSITDFNNFVDNYDVFN